jgi:hypothetical protein
MPVLMPRALLVVAAMAVVLPLCAQPVAAPLTCEQIVASAQAAVKLRDQGVSLSQVLAETDKAGMRERFRPVELGMIRQAVRLAYTGEISVYELADACAEGRDGKRR